MDRPALWAALSDMQIDPPAGAARFEEALAEQQGWPLDFANRVTDEYRRFLYLAATSGSEMTPSQAVDEAWHLHLTLPHYRERLCERILGRALGHRPGTGEPEEEERYRLQYERTLALYDQIFREPPPADIWPRPEPPEREEIRWWHGRESQVAATIAAAATGLGALAFDVPDLGRALVFVALVAGLSILWEIRARKRGGRRGSGDYDVDGDSISCGSSSEAGCGSSCGGGCGGGGD